MFIPPSPFQPRPVPRFPGWMRSLGPGIVWMALAQGSGELIWWPYMVAKYGLAFLFLLLPSALLQYPLTYEIGRYTLYTGESAWKGFIRLHPVFAGLLWIVMMIQFLWFGAYASSGGTALAALTHFPPGLSARGQSLFWAYASIAVFLGALLASRTVYKTIERLMWAVAVLTFAGLLAACTHPVALSSLPEVLRSLAVPAGAPARPWDPADATPLLTAVTFMGLGGFWTLFYSYWIREKGCGMALYRLGSQGGEGFVPSPDAREAPALRQWLRFLRVDAGIGIAGNVATTLMTCLLAYAVLFPEGIAPKDWEIAAVQARFFELRWGGLGRGLFLIVAAAFLADTWLTTVDAVSRVNTDVVRNLFPGARSRSERWWYYAFLGLFSAVTAITMPLAQPGPLMMLSAVIGFAGTVVFTAALGVLNFRRLPRSLPAWSHPGRFARLALSFSWVSYLGLMGAYLWALSRP